MAEMPAASLMAVVQQRIDVEPRGALRSLPTSEAFTIAGLVIDWALVQHELDRDAVSAEDFLGLFDPVANGDGVRSRATLYRQLKRYRQLFPDVDINDVAAQIRGQIESEKFTKKELGMQFELGTPEHLALIAKVMARWHYPVEVPASNAAPGGRATARSRRGRPPAQVRA